jgi:glycosyltransferase involved in cell wall biosynthesis
MNKRISITVVVPALNEEKNIKGAVGDIMGAFKDSAYDWEIVLVDDGSSDATGRIIDELVQGEPRVKAIHHNIPCGIGYCLREGIKASSKEVLTWLPADGENSSRELLKYLPLIEHVDIVIPFAVNKKVRPLLRRILSAMYLTIINMTFRTRFNYTNGNIIYRKRIFDVVEPRSNGFLVHAECLVRAIRAGFTFAEVPVTLSKRRGGDSKAMLFDSFFTVCREFIALFYYVHIASKLNRRSK